MFFFELILFTISEHGKCIAKVREIVFIADRLGFDNYYTWLTLVSCVKVATYCKGHTSVLKLNVGTWHKLCAAEKYKMSVITRILGWVKMYFFESLDNIKSIIETNNNAKTAHSLSSFHTIALHKSHSQRKKKLKPSPWPIVTISELLLLPLPALNPMNTLYNLNLIFTLFGIPRTTLFGHNLLPRELLIWTVLYRSFTHFGMKNYFFILYLWFSVSIHRISFPIVSPCQTLVLIHLWI